MSRRFKFVAGFAVLAAISVVIAIYFTYRTGSAVMATGAMPSASGIWSAILPFLAGSGFSVASVAAFFMKSLDSISDKRTRSIAVGIVSLGTVETYCYLYANEKNHEIKASIRVAGIKAVDDLVATKWFPVTTEAAQ